MCQLNGIPYRRGFSCLYPCTILSRQWRINLPPQEVQSLSSGCEIHSMLWVRDPPLRLSLAHLPLSSCWTCRLRRAKMPISYLQFGFKTNQYGLAKQPIARKEIWYEICWWRKHQRLGGNKRWMAMSCEIAQDQRSWAAAVKDAMKSKAETSTTRHRWTLKQLQVTFQTLKGGEITTQPNVLVYQIVGNIVQFTGIPIIVMESL